MSALDAGQNENGVVHEFCVPDYIVENNTEFSGVGTAFLFISSDWKSSILANAVAASSMSVKCPTNLIGPLEQFQIHEISQRFEI